MPDAVSTTDVEAYLSRLCQSYYVYTHLEPTNACNADCAVCPREAMDRKLVMMTWPTFVHIMDAVLPTPIPMLAIVGFGEPTLHRQVIDMIGYARSRRPDLVIKVTTNGSRINDRNIDSFFGAGLDLLEISVFGHSPETYEAQMAGLKFAHIKQLLNLLNERGYRYSLTTVQSDDAPAGIIRDFWSSLGAARLSIKGLHRRGGYLELGEPVTREQAIGSYRERNDVTADALPVDSCHKLYMFLHVNASGQILPCVQEINAKNILGRIVAGTSIESVTSTTRAHRPVFDICRGCELKQQDLMEYYSRFFAGSFSERIPVWQARLDSADTTRLDSADTMSRAITFESA